MITRHLSLTLILLSVFATSAKAIPSWDGGLIIEPFWQIDRQWKDKPYGNPSLKETIGGKGCATTSLAMLLKYHGLRWMPAALHEPSSIKIDSEWLNDWLLNNSGYDKSNTVNWWEIKNFYYHSYVFLNWNNFVSLEYNCSPVSNKNNCFNPAWSSDAGILLEDDLWRGMPDIMRIKNPKSSSHFVLISGYSQEYKSYRANDPAIFYNRLPAPSLTEFYQNKEGTPTWTPLGIRRFSAIYSRKPPNLSKLTSWVYSPVHIQIIDSLGRVTGYDPVSEGIVEDIPRASYYEESISSLNADEPNQETVKVLHIDEPATSGNNILKIFGIGDGPYTIKMQGTKEDGTINLDTTLTGTAYVGLAQTYRVTYSPTGEASLSSTNQAPVANVGANQTGEQSYEIQLDGSATSDPDGDPLKYAWSFISRPDGSNAALSDASAISPTFTPDLPGTYVLQLVANDYFTDSEPSTVTITAIPIQSRISVTPNFSAPLSAGSGFLSFDMNNSGRVGVSSGVIEMNLTAPDGTLAYAGSQGFSLAAGQSKTVDIPIVIPSLKFGNYILTYTQSDETRTGSPTPVPVPNTVVISLSFDKPSYNVRETANVTVNLTNTGRFKIDQLPMVVSMPDAGFAETKTISLLPDAAQSFTASIAIPDTVTGGQHDVNATLTASPRNSIVQNAKLAVPESTLVLGMVGTGNLMPGDRVNLTIENIGGFDTSYTAEKLNISDSKGVILYQDNPTGTILAGEKKPLAEVLIPSQVATGTATLSVHVRDNKTGRLFYINRAIGINGLTEVLQTRTDKATYLTPESITGITSISNGQFPIENGNLNIKVVRTTATGTGQFSQILPRSGWWPIDKPFGIAIGPDGFIYAVDTNYDRVLKFDKYGNYITGWGAESIGKGESMYPQWIAVAPDGSVYVSDTSNSRILKFDSNGAFVTKWGSFGSEDGQFYGPEGIAVASDGSVYVAEYWNNRIQKFNANGVFIAKWGSYGVADGQFAHPWSVTVAQDGYVYVADTDNHRIQKFDPDGNFIAKWGGYGSGNGQFNKPYSISAGVDGYLYVADSYNDRLQKFDSNGVFVAKYGSSGIGNGQFNLPLCVVAGADGTIYVADTNNNRMQKFDGNGAFISKWSMKGSGNGQFTNPADIATGPDGSFYVVEGWSNQRVQKFDKNGNFTTRWGNYGNAAGQFSWPSGIAVSSDGFVYVADSNNARIQKFDSNGNFITKWGGFGSGNGQFRSPSAIAVAPDGSVYVGDEYYDYSTYTGYDRIQKFDSNGNFIASWGSYGSGIGQFGSPRGIAIGSDGSVYVAEMGNHRVQKFDKDGNFVRMWGSYCIVNLPYSSCEGRFSNPKGVAVSPDGFVYVVEAYNKRVQKFDSDGKFISKWESQSGGFEQFAGPDGIAVGPDGSVYVVDAYNHRIAKMVPLGVDKETFFDSTIPVSIEANTSQDYTTNVGPLNVKGKLYIEALLSNSLGQTVASSRYPFYIVEGKTLLLFNTDKKVYKPGETVAITGEIMNLATTTASALTLRLSANGITIYSSVMDVPAGNSSSFIATTTAGSEGTVTLVGSVSQGNTSLIEIADQYEVTLPKLAVSISGPDVAGRNPFDLIVEVNNTGKVDISGQMSVTDSQGDLIDSQQINIPAGETISFQYMQQIAADALYTAMITGDAGQTATKTVLFGEAVGIGFVLPVVERTCSPPVCSPGDWQCYMRGLVCQDILKPYAEGRVGIPVMITNTGQVEEQIQVTYQLNQDSTGDRSHVPLQNTDSRTYYLPKGGSITDTLYYDLTKGSYQLSAVSNQPYATAQTSFTVGKENDVTMTNTVGSHGTNGIIPVTVNLTNNGVNEINGSIPLTVTNNQGNALWRGAAQVSGLRPQTSANYLINVDSSGIVSGAYKAEMALFSTSGLELASNQAQIRVAGPIFEITSIPDHPTFTVGKQALFTFSIKNTGTQAGTTSFNVKAMGVLNQTITDTLNSGEERSHTFTFPVPEDAVEDDYFADYVLAPVLSQGTKGQVGFHVTGVKIGATATLDKTAYINGDTALLTLPVSKLSQFEDGDCLAIIRYGTHHDMKQFTLTNQGTTLTFSVPLPVITGENLFYSIHFPSGRAISRNTIFINKAQPDLVVDNLSVSQNSTGTFKIEASVTNQGETASGASAIAFYDGPSDNVLTGDSPNSTALQAGKLGTVPLPSLMPGESKTVSLNWDVVGKAGKHIVYAVADPNNTVMERIEVNNTQAIEVSVPNFALGVSTTEPAYKANRDAGIVANIANLTSGAIYQGLNLGITISGPLGIVPLDTVKELSNLPPAQVFSYAFNWNTGTTPPGDYTLKGRLLEGVNTLAEGSALFAVLPTNSVSGDFTLSKDTVIQGFDLNIDYTLTNNGNIDLSGGELKAEFIAGQGSTISAAYTRTFGALQVLKSLPDSIAIDKLQIEPGDYIVSLTATVAGESFVIGERNVKVLPPLDIKKGLSAMPRVLVLIDRSDNDEHEDRDEDEKEHNSAGQNLNERIITDALNSIQAYYMILRDKKWFKEAMRSGIYSTFILVGRGPLEDHLDEEFSERINSGEGLILINYEHLEDEKFREVTGVKAEGYLSDKQRIVDLSQSPVSLPGTVNISGKVERLIIQSAQAVTAGTITEDNYSHPALVLNPYGKGKTVIFAFDPAESAKINGTAPYVQLLSNAVLYASQQEIKPVPGWPLPVEIDIKTIGADFDLKVVEKMSKGSLVLLNPQGVVEESADGQTVTWEFHLGKDNTKRLFYLEKLPEDSGSYNFTTDISYFKDGSYKPYNTYTLTAEATKGLIDLQSDILNNLKGLSGVNDGNKLARVIREYEEIMNWPLHDAKEKEDVIKGLLGVIEELKELNADTANIRLDLDMLLKIFERKWVERQEKKNED